MNVLEWSPVGRRFFERGAICMHAWMYHDSKVMICMSVLVWMNVVWNTI